MNCEIEQEKHFVLPLELKQQRAGEKKWKNRGNTNQQLTMKRTGREYK